MSYCVGTTTNPVVTLERQSVNKEGNIFRFPRERLGNETAKLVNSFHELNDEKDAALAYFIQAIVITLILKLAKLF